MTSGSFERDHDSDSLLLDDLAVAVSAVSDHGVVIAIAVFLEALWSKRPLQSVLLRLAAVGLSVLAVNTSIKDLVGRARPAGSDVVRLGVRTPSSSSFPSGHTLAVATAGVALPSTTLGVGGGLVAASLVGWSRVRLRAHHGSDVIGALLIGAGLGAGLRPVIRRLDRE